MSSAIGNDAPFENDLSGDDAAEELLKLWQDDADEDQPSDEPEEEDDEDLSSDDEDEDSDEDADDDQEDSDEDEDESDEDEEDEDEPKKRKVLKDDALVKVKVGDTEEEVPVSKLTRLYGQEKALTQKSMEVAERRKELESLGERHVAASTALLERAHARYEPFAKIDWALAAKNLDHDEYNALKEQATLAYQDIQFLSQEVESYVAEVQQQREFERINTAKETLKVLSDPKTGIPGFNQQMYKSILEYAVSEGLPVEAANQIVEAVPLKFMWKAMMLDKGKKAVTTKVDKKNKKIVKSRSSSEASKPTFTKSKDKDAVSRLKRTGSPDDAAAALLARWADSDD